MVDKNFIGLDKPDITRFESYLPTAFSGELTLLQKVNKIIQDLNRSFDLTNEMVDYLNRFIEMFDEKLYETIEDVLTVWLEDGRLSDIVREAINEEVIVAREDNNGKIYPTLKERLDSNQTDVNLIFKSIREFPRYEDETDDTLRFTRALNSGFNIVLEHNQKYICDTVHIKTSNIIVMGNFSEIKALNKETDVFMIGSDNNGDFVKTDNVSILNIHFLGVDNTTSGRLVSTGINIRYEEVKKHASCENIVIENCSFKKFTMGLIGTGVTNLRVVNCHSENHYYKEELLAGGYGVLIQSCFDVKVNNNTFIGFSGDRHGIYLSNIKNDSKVNEDVIVTGNIIDWSNVFGITGYEACIVARSHINLLLSNNTLINGFGGIQLLQSNGNGVKIVIENNFINGCQTTSMLGSKGAIGVLNDMYELHNLTIQNNTILTDNIKIQCLHLNTGDNVKILNNTFKATDDGISFIGVKNVVFDNNHFIGCSKTAVRYIGSVENVLFKVNSYDITGLFEFGSNNYPQKNIKHTFSRYARVTSKEGVLSLTVNEYGVIKNVEPIPQGFRVYVSNNVFLDMDRIDAEIIANNDFMALKRSRNFEERYVEFTIVNRSAVNSPLDFTTVSAVCLIVFKY